MRHIGGESKGTWDSNLSPGFIPKQRLRPGTTNHTFLSLNSNLMNKEAVNNPIPYLASRWLVYFIHFATSALGSADMHLHRKTTFKILKSIIVNPDNTYCMVYLEL